MMPKLMNSSGNNNLHFSLGELVTALRSLGREDAADILLSGCSLYRISGPAGHGGHVGHDVLGGNEHEMFRHEIPQSNFL